MADKNYWGYHCSVDGSGCDHDAIVDHDTIAAFTKDLVEKIGMVAYGEPQIVNFGTGDKAGYTLVQLIETSCITAHFVNELDELYLDVFSCKHFDEDDVTDKVIEWFGPSSTSQRFTTRVAPRP